MRAKDHSVKEGMGKEAGSATPDTDPAESPAASDVKDPAKLPLYDQAFKLLFRRYPQLVIPLVNEAFGNRYPPDTPVELLNTEHMNTWGATYSDAVITIAGDVYHLEG